MTIFALVTFGLTVLSALISCAAAVVSFAYSRKPASVQLQQNVDEMISVMDKLMKDVRREKMRNVRAAHKDVDALDSKVPVQSVVEEEATTDKKSELRRRLQQLRGRTA